VMAMRCGGRVTAALESESAIAVKVVYACDL